MERIEWVIERCRLLQAIGDELDETKRLPRSRARRRASHGRRRRHRHRCGGRRHPRPLGNSVESMDLGFALQARCLEAVARGTVGVEACVVQVPRDIDEQVASSFISAAT